MGSGHWPTDSFEAANAKKLSFGGIAVGRQLATRAGLQKALLDLANNRLSFLFKACRIGGQSRINRPGTVHRSGKRKT